MIVTMDGGAASGKSTTAKQLAEKADLLYVDTGAHYRALTSLLLDMNIDISNKTTIASALSNIQPDVKLQGREALIQLNGKVFEDNKLRSDVVNAGVSQVAAVEEVRGLLLSYQRSFVEKCNTLGFKGLVMEGRDIGSVVLPDADFRFFIEADEATRQKRRTLQGQVDSIQKRDKMDQQRKAAPLVCPKGAIRIDTSHITIQEAVDKVYSIITNER